MQIVVNGWFWSETAVGSGRYLAALAAVLPRLATTHELVLALPALRTASGSLPDGWRPVRLRTPFDRLSSDLAKVWFEQIAFPALCHRLGAGVGFVPYWGSPWFRPCPMVVTVHDLIPLLLPLYRGGALQRLYTRLVWATARRAAAVVTDSEASRRDIVKHLRMPAERVHAIHLAADSCCCDATKGDASDLRARLGLPDGPFFLYLGGFDARKNVLRTLHGYAKFAARCATEGSDAPALVVAGRLPAIDSPLAPDPRSALSPLGIADRVYFTGWVSDADKAALYRLATGTLFVSEYEGFGLPVLEAMACDEDAASSADES